MLSQLPELASPCPESRLLADRLLGEEVAQLDAGAEELLQPGRALLLQVRGLAVSGGVVGRPFPFIGAFALG